MAFGNFHEAPAIVDLCDELKAHVVCDSEASALARAREWAVAFAPVAKIVDELDATRPKPSYEFAEISSAVRRNVEDAMGLAFSTCRPVPIKWRKIQYVDEKGNTAWAWEGVEEWPPDTKHGASKFGVSAAGSSQCEACGHAIRNPRNWVPLLLDDSSGGVPHSLWVGRDCARHLFGCTATGTGMFPSRFPGRTDS